MELTQLPAKTVIIVLGVDHCCRNIAVGRTKIEGTESLTCFKKLHRKMPQARTEQQGKDIIQSLDVLLKRKLSDLGWRNNHIKAEHCGLFW